MWLSQHSTKIPFLVVLVFLILLSFLLTIFHKTKSPSKLTYQNTQYAHTTNPTLTSSNKDVTILSSGERLYLKDKRLEIDGVIVYPSMPIEVFACVEGGKDYEALIVLNCNPQNVHTALLSMGLKDGSLYGVEGPAYLGDPTKPVGDRVKVTVRWIENSTIKEHYAEELLKTARTGKALEKVGWTFSGSCFNDEMDFETGLPTGKQVYMANITRTIISTYHDPTSIIDNPLSEGGIDMAYAPNINILPKKGTNAIITISVPTSDELKQMLELEKIIEKAIDWQKTKSAQDSNDGK